MKKINIYIAGKVTGMPHDLTVAKFKAAADTIEGIDKNYQVFNPMEIVEEGTPYAEAMAMLQPFLEKSHVIVLLPDWVDSRGAIIEHEIATARNIIDVTFENIDEIPCLVRCLQ